jgi:hypothetical protein
MAFVIVGCSSNFKYNSIDVIEINNSINETFDIRKNFKKTEYVILDDSVLIAGILDICMTKEYYYIRSLKLGGVFQFDRSGKYIRTFAMTGNGPEETSLILSVSADEEKERIYVSQLFNCLVFDFEGNLLETVPNKKGISWQRHINNDAFAEIGAEYVPYSVPEMFGIGIFSLHGDTIAIKNDIFPTDVQDFNRVGFSRTFITNSSKNNEVLCYVSSCDTIFRLTEDKISNAYAINTGNSSYKKIESIEIFDNDISEDIYDIYDFIELNNNFYLRAIRNHEMYLFSYDKTNKKTQMMKSSINLSEAISLNQKMQSVGIPNKDGGIPIWGCNIYPKEKILIQICTYEEMCYLNENKIINSNSSVYHNYLNNEDSNPIIILHYIK